MFDVDSDHDENEASDDNDSRTDEFAFECDVMSNLHPQKYPNIYLFSRLCDKPLERVSIRNARYYDEDAEDRDFLDQNSFNQDPFT